MTQQLQSWAFIHENWKAMFTLKPVHSIYNNFIYNRQTIQLRCTSTSKNTHTIPQPGLTFRELCWVEQANSKTLHNIWWHLYNVIDMTNIDIKNRLMVFRDYRGGRKGSRYSYSWATWRILVVMGMFSIFCWDGFMYINLFKSHSTCMMWMLLLFSFYKWYYCGQNFIYLTKITHH